MDHDVFAAWEQFIKAYNLAHRSDLNGLVRLLNRIFQQHYGSLCLEEKYFRYNSVDYTVKWTVQFPNEEFKKPIIGNSVVISVISKDKIKEINILDFLSYNPEEGILLLEKATFEIT